jgi:hypothetical protein
MSAAGALLATWRAEACSQGFGPSFLVELDSDSGSVVVDPAWWLTRYDYDSDDLNPFKMPGYYHAMSYYGDLPDGPRPAGHRLRGRLDLHDVLHGSTASAVGEEPG